MTWLAATGKESYIGHGANYKRGKKLNERRILSKGEEPRDSTSGRKESGVMEHQNYYKQKPNRHLSI